MQQDTPLNQYISDTGFSGVDLGTSLGQCRDRVGLVDLRVGLVDLRVRLVDLRVRLVKLSYLLDILSQTAV